jgi:FMN phosphatase YigB (HAD superfamily)
MDLFGFFGGKAARKQIDVLERPRDSIPAVELTPAWWNSKTHVLLDMDGTLIPQPGALFHQLFTVFAIARLAPLGDIRTVFRAVRQTKSILLSQHDFANNRDAFFETLASELRVTRAKVERFSQRFFDSDYPFICLILGADESARRLIDLLHATGRHVTLATNAVFGRREIEMRLKASNLYLHDFDYVTSWDVMKSTKPHKAFFEDVLKTIGAQPKSTVMIGNDPYYDLPAYQAGITTLLVGPALSLRQIADSLEAHRAAVSGVEPHLGGGPSD